MARWPRPWRMQPMGTATPAGSSPRPNGPGLPRCQNRPAARVSPSRTSIHIDLKAGNCTCPAGAVTTRLHSQGHDREGYRRRVPRQAFVFEGAVCDGCALLPHPVAAAASACIPGKACCRRPETFRPVRPSHPIGPCALRAIVGASRPKPSSCWRRPWPISPACGRPPRRHPR